MKNKIVPILIFLFFCSMVAVFLNKPVTTKKGINYVRYEYSMPLYLKILNFLDRHYNYKNLLERIIKKGQTDSERAKLILQWTYENIKRRPEELPVIDDHAWYTIIRGYGVSDQFNDVFSTLCNYAQLDSFFDWVYSNDKQSRLPISYVKIDNKWHIFDPYNGVMFMGEDQEFAGIDEIISDKYSLISLNKAVEKEKYDQYFGNLNQPKTRPLSRSSIQSPLARFIYEIKKKF